MTALRLAAAALLIIAIAAVALLFPLASWVTTATAWAESHRAATGALYVGVYTLAAVLVVPATLITLVSGYLFGLPLGVAFASAGSVLGAAGAFVFGRFVARDWVARRISAWPRFRAFDIATRQDGFIIVLLARLSPLVPYNLLNYALSVTGVRFWDYVLASWIGMLPATVVYVYFGTLAQSVATLVSDEPAPRPAAQVLLVLGLVATVVLTAVIGRRASRVLRDRLADAAQASPPDGAQ